jgi:peptidoglycan/LPS O-acetylase OafA/YrhL
VLILLCVLILVSLIYGCFSKEEDIDHAHPANLPSYYHSVDTTIAISELEHGGLYSESAVKRFLDAFHVGKALSSLWSTKTELWHEEDLYVLSGVRMIAFMLVVLFQTFVIESFVYKNYAGGASVYDSPWYLLVLLGYKGIDTFFFLSGFFAAYMLYSKMSNMEFSTRHYLEIIFHRWLRLWPLYIIILLLYWKVSIYFAKGPLWIFYAEQAQSCETSWIHNLFLMDNWLIGED